MIYFIAPYTLNFLGASRKIEGLISVLSKIDTVLLINTFDDKPSSYYIKSKLNIDVYDIKVYHSKRAVNTTIHYLRTKKVIQELRKKYETPTTIWLYNSYIYESHLANKLAKLYNAYLILEVEDAVFSRGRGLNPKPYFDQIAWKKNMKSSNYVLGVNTSIYAQLKQLDKEVLLLPGLLSNQMIETTNQTKPFNQNNTITIGYFGGLFIEKGAAFLLELFDKMPENFICHVTGTGELNNEFISQAKKYPKRFYYHGRVAINEIFNLMAKCDVIVNPHQPISTMNDGVFPFKVLEAVASKRLVLSTDLPTENMEEVLKGIHFLNLNIAEWENALLNAKDIYVSNQQSINTGAELAINRYSEDAVHTILKTKIQA